MSRIPPQGARMVGAWPNTAPRQTRPPRPARAAAGVTIRLADPGAAPAAPPRARGSPGGPARTAPAARPSRLTRPYGIAPQLRVALALSAVRSTERAWRPQEIDRPSLADPRPARRGRERRGERNERHLGGVLARWPPACRRDCAPRPDRRPRGPCRPARPCCSRARDRRRGLAPWAVGLRAACGRRG